MLVLLILLLVLWGTGYKFKVGGNLIHILLVIALILLLLKLL